MNCAHGEDNSTLEDGPPHDPVMVTLYSVPVPRLPRLEVVLRGNHFVQLLSNDVQFFLCAHAVTCVCVCVLCALKKKIIRLTRY